MWFLQRVGVDSLVPPYWERCESLATQRTMRSRYFVVQARMRSYLPTAEVHLLMSARTRRGAGDQPSCGYRSRRSILRTQPVLLCSIVLSRLLQFTRALCATAARFILHGLWFATWLSNVDRQCCYPIKLYQLAASGGFSSATNGSRGSIQAQTIPRGRERCAVLSIYTATCMVTALERLLGGWTSSRFHLSICFDSMRSRPRMARAHQSIAARRQRGASV